MRSQRVEAEGGVVMLMASSGAPGGRVRVAMEPRERDGLNDQATRATLLAVCKISTDRKARMQAGLDGGAAAAEAAAKAATAAEAVAVAIARAARASEMDEASSWDVARRAAAHAVGGELPAAVAASMATIAAASAAARGGRRARAPPSTTRTRCRVRTRRTTA